jgi:holo-[acyl-carrier protein] synthase
MAIVGHGIDLVRIDRIAEMIDKHGRHFLDRCFTAAEQAYCQDHAQPAQHYAGRFALKEAVLKALGTGWRGQIAWTDIDILREASGRPRVVLGGECGRIAERLGIRCWHISISHAGDYAMASTVAED